MGGGTRQARSGQQARLGAAAAAAAGDRGEPSCRGCIGRCLHGCLLPINAWPPLACINRCCSCTRRCRGRSVLLTAAARRRRGAGAANRAPAVPDPRSGGDHAALQGSDRRAGGLSGSAAPRSCPRSPAAPADRTGCSHGAASSYAASCVPRCLLEPHSRSALGTLRCGAGLGWLGCRRWADGDLELQQSQRRGAGLRRGEQTEAQHSRGCRKTEPVGLVRCPVLRSCLSNCPRACKRLQPAFACLSRAHPCSPLVHRPLSTLT